LPNAFLLPIVSGVRQWQVAHGGGPEGLLFAQTWPKLKQAQGKQDLTGPLFLGLQTKLDAFPKSSSRLVLWP